MRRAEVNITPLERAGRIVRGGVTAQARPESRRARFSTGDLPAVSSRSSRMNSSRGSQQRPLPDFGLAPRDPAGARRRRTRSELRLLSGRRHAGCCGEPEPHLRALAQARADRVPVEIEVRAGAAEAPPPPTASSTLRSLRSCCARSQTRRRAARNRSRVASGWRALVLRACGLEPSGGCARQACA